MAEEKDKRRPAHEVVLEGIELNARIVRDAGSEFVTVGPYHQAEVLRVLCGVLREMQVPEKHLREAISRLQQLKSTVPSSGSEFMFPLEALLYEAISDLEARQAEAQQPKPAEAEADGAAETTEPVGVIGGLAPTAPPDSDSDP